MLSLSLKNDDMSNPSNDRFDKAVVIGSIIHSLAFGQLEIINHGAIIYSIKTGIIDKIENLEHKKLETIVENISKENIKDYSGKLIMPGFVDAHCHAPQYVFTGTGMDLPLLQWLEKYTFPCEARFSDLEFARVAYEKSVKRHLKYGTTFASYFATIHSSAAKVLVDVILSCGQRAHVGKVSMDRNSPEFYIEDTNKGCKGITRIHSIQSTYGYSYDGRLDAESFVRDVLSLTPQGRRFVQAVDNISQSNEVTIEFNEERNYTFPSSLYSSNTLLNKPYAPLVFPCITPRFVPTCTSDMMHQLGQISAKYGLPVQSHLSESPGEIAWVAELHPECPSYAEVYYNHGLLHHATYMAHCCHSDEMERNLLSQTRCGVVHCASSNFMLGSGVMDVRQFLEEGIQVALGSDVAGGYSPSMLDAIRQSLIASNCCSMDHRDGKRKPINPIRSSMSMPSLATTNAASSLPVSSMMPPLGGIMSKSNGFGNGPHMSRSVSFDTRPKIRAQSDLSLSMLSGEDDNQSIVEQNEWDQFALDMSGHGNENGIATTRRSSAASDVAETKPLLPPSDDDGMTSISSLQITATGESIKKTYEPLNYKEAYHLATQGGAEVLGMGDVVGNFLIGKKFDAIVVDVAKVDGPIDIFGGEDILERFQKFLFLGDDRNIISVYVDGKLVL